MASSDWDHVKKNILSFVRKSVFKKGPSSLRLDQGQLQKGTSCEMSANGAFGYRPFAVGAWAGDGTGEPLLERSVIVAGPDGAPVGACLVSRWRGRPLPQS